VKIYKGKNILIKIDLYLYNKIGTRINAHGLIKQLKVKKMNFRFTLFSEVTKNKKRKTNAINSMLPLSKTKITG
jgi:hypothetical protein